MHELKDGTGFILERKWLASRLGTGHTLVTHCAQVLGLVAGNRSPIELHLLRLHLFNLSGMIELYSFLKWLIFGGAYKDKEV